MHAPFLYKLKPKRRPPHPVSISYKRTQVHILTLVTRSFMLTLHRLRLQLETQHAQTTTPRQACSAIACVAACRKYLFMIHDLQTTIEISTANASSAHKALHAHGYELVLMLWQKRTSCSVTHHDTSCSVTTCNHTGTCLERQQAPRPLKSTAVQLVMASKVMQHLQQAGHCIAVTSMLQVTTMTQAKFLFSRAQLLLHRQVNLQLRLLRSQAAANNRVPHLCP